MTGERPPRRALLLGCGTFTDPSLAGLRSPHRDVRDLRRALTEPVACGYAATSVLDCTSGQAQREIEGFLAAASVRDALNLLYISGHGVQDEQGRLYFAFTDTDRELLHSTAVSAEWVRDRIRASRSRATLVLVDCCFSGAFITGMRARSAGANVESLVRDLPEGSGVAVLTASGATEASFEDATSEVVRPSYFSDAVITGISTGAADLNGDGRITVEELYEYVYQAVTRGPSAQRPRRLGAGEGMLVVADGVVPAGGPGPAHTRTRRRPGRRPSRALTLAMAGGAVVLAAAFALPGLPQHPLAAPDQPAASRPAPGGSVVSPAAPSSSTPPPSRTPPPPPSATPSAPRKPKTVATPAVTTTRTTAATVAASTGSISSPAPDADVQNCAYFTGRSRLAPGETLILAMRNLSNGQPDKYVERAFGWDKPETLGSWRGAQYFNGDAGQHYEVELMAVDLEAVRAARSGTANNALAGQGRLLASREVVRQTGTTGDDCPGP